MHLDWLLNITTELKNHFDGHIAQVIDKWLYNCHKDNVRKIIVTYKHFIMHLFFQYYYIGTEHVLYILCYIIINSCHFLY